MSGLAQVRPAPVFGDCRDIATGHRRVHRKADAESVRRFPVAVFGEHFGEIFSRHSPSAVPRVSFFPADNGREQRGGRVAIPEVRRKGFVGAVRVRVFPRLQIFAQGIRRRRGQPRNLFPIAALVVFSGGGKISVRVSE